MATKSLSPLNGQPTNKTRILKLTFKFKLLPSNNHLLAEGDVSSAYYKKMDQLSTQMLQSNTSKNLAQDRRSLNNQYSPIAAEQETSLQTYTGTLP